MKNTTHLLVGLMILVVAGCGSDKSKKYKSAFDSANSGSTSGGSTGTSPTGPVALTSVTPNNGAAGDIVMLIGDNFDAFSTVEFAGVQATNVSVTSLTQLTCQAPVMALGTLADIEVINRDGTRARLNNAFTYNTNGTSGGLLARVANYGNPTAMEQELLELTNRARRDPVAEGQRVNVNFSAYVARPPLTFNGELIKAALGHTNDMVRRSFYAHVNPDGINANGRIRDTNYELNGSYPVAPAANLSENIGVGNGNRFLNAQDVHDSFIIDAGLVYPKHRLIMLGVGGHFTQVREVGMGFRTAQNSPGQIWTAFVTQEFAFSKTDRAFVTGVAFNDRSGDGVARAGEGIKGATVVLRHASGFQISTTTADAGGYAFEILVDGIYTIEINGVSTTVTVTKDNVKVDLKNGQIVTH